MNARFLEEGLVDRLAVFIAPKLAGADGVPLLAARGPSHMADAIRLDEVQVERVGDDVLVIGRPVRPGARPLRAPERRSRPRR